MLQETNLSPQMALAWTGRRYRFGQFASLPRRVTLMYGRREKKRFSHLSQGGALMHKPRVLLADDNDRILTVSSKLLGGDCEVVGTVCDGDSAVQAANQLRPDLVVLDISMPGTDGIQAARQLQKLELKPRIVFLTFQEDPDLVQIARTMGASYVVKARMYSDLLVAIKEALAGRVFVSRVLMDRHTRLGIR